MTSPPLAPGSHEPPAHDPSPAWEPRGHVVRWASAPLALTVGLLVTSILFGLLAPRVSVDGSAWGLFPGTTDRVFVQITVTNHAYAPAQLAGVTESPPGLELVSTSVTPGDPPPVTTDLAIDDPTAPLALGHGESATVTVVWEVTDCRHLPADDRDLPVRLRTPLGLARTVGATFPDASGATGAWAVEVAGYVCAPEGRS